ncbi:cell wall-binding repeat-containing protein [Clostridium senegalense]|uniref:Cell wall-binding repeat-containing protein n=1 Tax=Clostridium senegalense TaxID=1465809 RepID=A0A6M0H2D2_9CLOT|nr:cell wall-binding repeat-containing protein [Clostridium senegalense]NEU04677.1 cell wall-binding repeat-containing protein [Clostridium senegalense]
MKNKINYLLIGAAILGICFTPINAMAENNRVNRIGGTDRYETSIEVAKKFVVNEKIDVVILVNGDDYPDTLTGAILSKKYNAPIIPLEYSPEKSEEQMEFIKTHLKTDGTIFLLGGEKMIDNSYVDEFNKLGYKNIERISGEDRYETNKKIVEKAEIKEGTPVIIANSHNVADALSMSSISASKQYPILVIPYHLSPNVIEQMQKIKPKEIFIAGGNEVIESGIQIEIKKALPYINYDNIVELSGKDRYETSMKVLNHFKDELNNENVFVTSGRSFTNALLGATLAAQTDSPLVLTESQSIVDSKPQLDDYKSVNIIGGKFSVEVFTEQRLNNEKEFSFKATSFSEENGKKYIHGTFNKLSNDVKEIEEYARFYEFDSNIVYEEGRKPWMPNLGQDIPMSELVDVEISDDVEIKVIGNENLDSNGFLGTKPITFDELRTNWSGIPIFRVEFENNKIVKITQEYRP